MGCMVVARIPKLIVAPLSSVNPKISFNHSLNGGSAKSYSMLQVVQVEHS